MRLELYGNFQLMHSKHDKIIEMLKGLRGMTSILVFRFVWSSVSRES